MVQELFNALLSFFVDVLNALGMEDIANELATKIVMPL